MRVGAEVVISASGIGKKVPILDLNGAFSLWYFHPVEKPEELRSCVCCGHATRKTDELAKLGLLGFEDNIKRLTTFRSDQ